MATLTGQSIASSYEQLLHVDTDGGGNTTTLVPIKDGDNGTTFAMQLSTTTVCIDNPTASSSTQGGILRLQSDDGAVMASGHRLGVIEFAGAEDTSNTITVGARIEAITDATWSASENGADMVFYTTDGNASQTEVMRLTADSGMTVGAAGAGHDVVFHSGTSGDNFTWDASEECLIITGTDGAQGLKVADGDLVVVDKIYLYDNDGGEYLSGDGTDLTITSGRDIKLSVASGGSVFCAGGGGTGNTVYGEDAGLQLASDDDYNVFVGKSVAIANMTDANYNIGIGYLALSEMTTGSNIVAIGANAVGGANAQSGANGAVAIGGDALKELTSGAANVAMGYQAGLAITDGHNNVIIGHQAGDATTVSTAYSVAIGSQAFGGSHAGGDSDHCVAIGYLALSGGVNNIDGTVAIGSSALAANTSGLQNTACGYAALTTNVDGSYNTAFGYEALSIMEADSANHGTNTAFGHKAGKFLSTGTDNTFVGASAGVGITGARQTGNNNTAVGAFSGMELEGAAHSNTFLGSASGMATETGTANTCLGFNTSTSADDSTNQTVIGSATAGVADNSVTLGNASVDAVYMAQDKGATVYAAGASFSKDSANTDLYIDSYHDTEATTPKIIMRKADGSLASPGAVDDNAIQGTISFQGYDGDQFIEGARIEALTNGNAADNDVGTNLNFYANAGGASVTLRAVVHAGGDFYTNDGSVSSLSDVRVKKDIADLTDGLSIVNQLKPRTYKYNGKGEMGSDDGITRYGFIADEVLDVASNYVNVQSGTIDEEKVDDLKSLSMMRMIPMLVKSIQELSAKVAALEAK